MRKSFSLSGCWIWVSLVYLSLNSSLSYSQVHFRKPSHDLIEFAIKGELEEIYSYLKSGNEVDGETSTSKNTALLIAVAKNDLKATRALLRFGANINHQNKKGLTPLMIASRAGNVKLVRVLLNHSPNIQLLSKEKKSALDYANANGNPEIIQSLEIARERLRRPAFQKLMAIEEVLYFRLPYELMEMILQDSFRQQESYWIFDGDTYFIHSDAQYHLGLSYLKGKRTQENIQKGLHWLHQAAKAENKNALNKLGQIYQEGKIVTADLEKSSEFFDRAKR